MLIAKFLFMRFYYEVERFVRDLANKYDKDNKKLLEIGAGDCPYREYFQKLEYKSLDVIQNKGKTIDYICDVNKGIPIIEDNEFDFILSTQVLEHLKNPHFVFKEFNRILKDGGKVFLTTNFIYPIHMAPNDYFRFTEYGLVELGKSNGFEIEYLEPHGGVFHVLSYLIISLPIKLFLKEESLLSKLYLFAFSPIIVTLNLFAIFLDKFIDKKKLWSINYEIVYRKK